MPYRVFLYSTYSFACFNHVHEMTKVKVHPLADVGHSAKNLPTHILAIKLERLIEREGFLCIVDELLLYFNVGEVMIELKSFFLISESKKLHMICLL